MSPTAGTVALDGVRRRTGGRSARVRASVMQALQAELAENGLANLSHRVVAERAGVDPATVYRRWPTRRRLLADLLLTQAVSLAPLPDTGSLVGDLSALLDSLLANLSDPAQCRLWRHYVGLSLDEDPEARAALAELWQGRYEGMAMVLTRAMARGELLAGLDPQDAGLLDAVVEALVAPVWFHALLTRRPFDAGLRQRCLSAALAILHGVRR